MEQINGSWKKAYPIVLHPKGRYVYAANSSDKNGGMLGRWVSMITIIGSGDYHIYAATGSGKYGMLGGWVSASKIIKDPEQYHIYAQ